MRTLVWYIILVAGLPTLLLGQPGTVILQVDKSLEAEDLWSMGLMHLANLRDSYLVQGDDRAVERLARFTEDFALLADVNPGQEVYLVRPANYKDEVFYSQFLIEVGGGNYLMILGPGDIEDTRFLPLHAARLRGGPFPQRDRRLATGVAPAPAIVIPKPQIENIVAAVSGDTLWKYISQLSGNEPVVINGVLDTLLTRYTWSWRVYHAADYLYERFEDYGYDVEFQEYVFGNISLHGLDAVDAAHAWAVGEKQKVFKTADGGLTWEEQPTGAFNTVFRSVCFLDTLKGWAVGGIGKVYATADGGASWQKQNLPSPYSVIYAVAFSDSLNGWVVGAGGYIHRTTDGGASWASVSSPTTEDLYGLDIRSTTKGWACGGNGTILFWNGSAWAPQTSGTTEHLRAVDFTSDNVGYAVGNFATVLRTADGGGTWVSLSMPPEIKGYLADVCFVDSTEGWAVGYWGTVLHTADAGSSWVLQDTPGMLDCSGVDFVDSSIGWVAGLLSTLWYTSDGGQAWESQTAGLPAYTWSVQKNVVATKPGTGLDEEVIVCGHYDSISESPKNLAPGADDNASGTAAVIEVARVTAGYPFERTIKYICFSAEERGPGGSADYVSRAAESGEPIVGAINLDMIAYVDAVPESIELIGDPPSEWLVDFTGDCADAYVPGLLIRKLIDETLIVSDHASFWMAGYDALCAIEDWPVRYPYYHTTADTLGHLTQWFATDVAKMAVATVAEIAGPDTTSGIDISGGFAREVSAYPNPVTVAVTISFALASRAHAEVGIYDVGGRLVRKLGTGPVGAGKHHITWEGADAQGVRVSPGVYFARVKTGHEEAYTKIVLLN